MTHQGLSSEESRFSRVINTSRDDFYPEPSTDLDLSTYLQALSHSESLRPSSEKAEISVESSDSRRRVLDRVLGKLSALEMGGKEHVEEYLRHQYRCHFGASTIRGNYRGLESFLRFIKEKGKGHVEEIAKGDLEAFVEHEQDRGLKLSTVKLKLTIVKAFLRFMVDQGMIEESVFPWKLQIKVPESLPRAMDPDDVERLLAVEGSMRDRAMVLVLLRTGMRIGELLGTKVRDVNMEEQKILIYVGEKNQRGRVIHFSDDAKDALGAWLKRRDQEMEFLFYGRRGKAMSYAAARVVFMKYLEKAGLAGKGYTLHCLRHTFATELLNARMPLECLEKLLGHSRLEVTRRYARLTDKTREEEYFKAMAIIERRERNGDCGCDCELPTILEEAQLFPSHREELHEHP